MPLLTTVQCLTTAALAALAVCGLLRGRNRLQGTTLMAYWWWTLGAIVTVAANEIGLAAAGGDAGAWSTHARFAAAATTFAPLMAVLGARRPHNGGWQFVVAALLLVLVWPAGEALLFRSDMPLELHTARQLFHLLLLAIGLLNALPTRCWLAALMWAAGQSLLLAEQLPAPLDAGLTWLLPSAESRALAGLFALTAAIWLRGWGLKASSASGLGLDRLWRGYRDEFGALWALRLAQRFNADAAICGWDARLTWNGLSSSARETSGEAISGTGTQLAPAARQALVNLLRRFVSEGWIAERAGPL